MKKAILFTLFVVLAIGIFAAIFGERVLLNWTGSKVPKTSLSQIKTLLEPSMVFRTPDPQTHGPGPYPVIVQFHGCAGARLEFQDLWAKAATDNGFMAVIVDSMRPRGFSRQAAAETICTGKKLLGQERAGDVAAALDLIRVRPEIDKERIILTGWSHGAWTVMDYLTMDFVKNGPVNLTSEDFSKHNQPDIDGVILFYPYCGLGTRSRLDEWQQKPQALSLIAGADTIVNHKDCLKRFSKLKQSGLHLDQTVYPDTEHAFDDPFIEEAYQHWHHRENMIDAMSRYVGFINRIK